MSQARRDFGTDFDIGAYAPTARFSNRATAYASYRPRYPYALREALVRETGLTPAAEVADIGSGTGLSAELFLTNGNRVFGVEPNTEMRAAGEAALGAYPNFVSIAGAAEATTLPDAAVDYVTVGQALHWFDLPRATAEFQRILRPAGWRVIMWNTRQADATPFMAAYEAVLRRYSPEYDAVKHDRIGAQELDVLYGQGGYRREDFANPYLLDFAAVLGRTASSSYAPAESTPAFGALVADLRALFDRYQRDGVVPFVYATELYFGQMASLDN